MKIKKFEELDCWKAARDLVRMIYQMTQQEQFYRDFGLRDQVQRAAVSAMANVAEGFAAYSDLDFIRFLNYSIRSTFEVKSHLYVALDIGYINRAEFESACKRAQDCANLSMGLIRYLKA